MIGINLPCIRFKGIHGTHNTFLKLYALKRGVILADENLTYRLREFAFADE